MRLRAGMAELTANDPQRASHVAERARLYLTEHGSSFPGNRSTGILDVGEGTQEAFETFANDAPCPALDVGTGLCDLYSARPMTCRVFGPPVRTEPDSDADTECEESLAVCELCFTHATPEDVRACEMKVPHEEEEDLLEKLLASEPDCTGDTIVAFCLIPLTSS